MAEEIVSQQELDSLLSSMEVVLSKQGEEQQATVMLYDFRQGVKLTAEQCDQVDEQINRLCSVLSRTLGAYLNTEVTLAVQGTAQATYEQYITNLASPIIMFTFELAPHAPLATWQIDGSVAYAIIDCMLGATGQNVEVPNRDMTTLEAALIGRFGGEILDTWIMTWKVLEAARSKVREVVTSLVKVEEINASKEQTYTGVIEVVVAGAQGHMDLSLPASALQPLLQSAEEQSTSSVEIAPVIMHSIGPSALSVRVTFDNRNISLSEVSHLQEGSVIDLHHYRDQPMTVSIAGRPKFLAECGVRRGQLAVRITRPVEG